MHNDSNNARDGDVSSAEAKAVIAFWRSAGPRLWFAKDVGFDEQFRTAFLAHHEAAARGDYVDWARTAYGALALTILLDQFPRNAFRDTQRMYATDAMACAVTNAAVNAGLDRHIDDQLVVFLYLPFSHSERLIDQERCVALMARLDEPAPTHARRHRDIIRRFGRFPHRNPILGRSMTAEEQCYLDTGGYQG